LASIIVVCLIIYYASLLILGEGSTLRRSEFLGFIALFSQVLSPLKVLSNVLARMQKAQAAFERLEELMAIQSEVQEVAQPQALPRFERELRFEGVWFRYEDQDVLQDVSFTLPQGKTLALVGPSGAGKSTLADLVPRFYDPYRGRILIDGVDLKELSLRDLRGQIGIVSQEAILFHDTVLANIAYGDPQPDRAAVEAAARMAYAHEFITQLPQDYDAMIGERGTMLSGGQRQRLSIARAIYRSPALLILDEATSNLDTQSEKLVQEALERLMRDRTSLVIAHRLSTIREADLILVLDQGRVIEQGDHESLLSQAGLYQVLFENLVKGQADR
jgi:ATP-binding cassette, subfamily B, bacterial MsbA